MNIEVFIVKKGKLFVAVCRDLSMSIQGKTPEEAVEKLQKNIVRFLAYKNNIFLEADIEFLTRHFYSNRLVQIH